MESKHTCDTCNQVGTVSTAEYWCYDCQEHFCEHCHICHDRFLPTHNARDLDEMEKVGFRRLSITSTVSKDSGISSTSFYSESSSDISSIDASKASHKPQVISLKLESTDLKCDLCSVKEIDLAATNWCHDCLKLFCANCNGCHEILLPQHNASDLDEVVSDEVIIKKSQSVILDKEIDDHAVSLKKFNQRTRTYIDELSSDCDAKCTDLWNHFEEMIETARQKAEELCKDMRQITAEQVKRCRHLLEENENILKELEKWRIDFHPGVDVISGLRSLGAKLSSRLHKSIGSENKCQLVTTFSNWWLQVMKQMKNETIGSVALTAELPAKNFEFEKQFNLCVSDITSIQCDGDDHIFVSDYSKQSVVEFTKQGELVCECRLFDGRNTFTPFDMCSISRDQFAVACGQEKMIILLEKRKNPSSLQIKKTIKTNKEFLSLCEINESIFVCDHFFQVDSITKEGKKIKTILTGESHGGFWPRIRADPMTGNFWGTKLNSFEISCFNPNGEKLRTVKTEEKITDICGDEFGYFYLCNYEGFLSFSPKNILYKFEKKSENHCRIFALKNTIFVCFRIDGEYVIKMFEEVQPKHNNVGESSQLLSVVEGSLKQNFIKPKEMNDPEIKEIRNLKTRRNIEKVKTEKIGSVSLMRKKLSPAKNFIIEKEWNLPESNYLIRSIHVCKEDNHVFLCDYNYSIMEFDKWGDLVCKCPLYEGGKKFNPFDMCQINSDIFIVVCGNQNKLIILERRKNPSLKIKKIIPTKNPYYSVCQINELIFVSGGYFEIHSITKDGKIIKTINIGGSRESGYIYNRIRFDPSSGFFWGTELTPFSSSELIYFNSNGEKIRSVKTGARIADFCLNEFDLFFSNQEGIFSLSTKKMLYKFERKSEQRPNIFVLGNKMFVLLRINGKDLIKILEMF